VSTSDLASKSRWKTWLDAGLSFFYPEVCQVCGDERATVEDGYVGVQCRKNAKLVEPPFCERCGLPFAGAITATFACANCREMRLYFSTARSAVEARGMVLDLIHRYKYQRALWLEPFLAGLLIDSARPCLERETWDMIVPVPLHPVKQNEREFNQAERLARRLGRSLSLPVQTGILRRVAPTRTQTQLTRAERNANVRRAFEAIHSEQARRKRIVLVDDVLTTGATTSACARLLKKSGAREVCVWTVARGIMN
jgi:ComF family protein